MRPKHRFRRPQPRPAARSFAALACAVALLGPLACVDIPPLPSDAGSSTGGSTGPDTTSGAGSGASFTSTTAPADSTRGTTEAGTTEVVTTEPATTGTETTGTDTTGVVFFAEPDVGSNFACSTLVQDCPPGQKCTAWANDGGGTWSSTRCVPLVDDPAQVGEPCHVEGSSTTGLDDCDLGSMCFHVDPETLEGTCFPYCTGSEAEPICEDPGRTCLVTGDALLLLCLPICDPLQQDCAEGDACYPVFNHWECATDASGDAGAYGDPCEFINVCDPGLVCTSSDDLPPGLPCEGALGCCSEICDLSGDEPCPGADQGVSCQPWYAPVTVPPGYEDVGVCALPK